MMSQIRRLDIVRKSGCLVLCGLFGVASSSLATPDNRTATVKSKPVAASKPQPVIIKMSATRELLSSTDHIGGAQGAGARQMIVEMAPHPVTIVKDATSENTRKESGAEGTSKSKP